MPVVEHWNSGNEVIRYGNEGDLAGPDREHAEVSMLACSARLTSAATSAC